MEKNKITKILTFFLIIAIIAIAVMGYFLYISHVKADSMISKEEELNTKIAKLEEDRVNKETQESDTKNNENTNINEDNNSKEKNDLKFSSLSGIYVGNAKVEPGTTPDGETEVKLYLYENGSFSYNDAPGLASGHVGYYTFSDNNLILHEVVECANDIGRTITNNEITLKINSDNTITDSKLNAVLKKSSEKIENKTDIISTELKNALNNKSLR